MAGTKVLSLKDVKQPAGPLEGRSDKGTSMVATGSLSSKFLFSIIELSL